MQTITQSQHAHSDAIAMELTPSSQQDPNPLTPTPTHHNPTSSQLPFGPPSIPPHLPHTYALPPRNLPATTTSPHSHETQNHRRHLFGLMCTYSMTTLPTPRNCYGRTKGNKHYLGTVIESRSANVNCHKVPPGTATLVARLDPSVSHATSPGNLSGQCISVGALL